MAMTFWTCHRIIIGRRLFGIRWNPEDATDRQRALIEFTDYTPEEEDDNGQRA